MAKNNVMAEIKELFQYIKTNYQEGVDFEIITEGESKHAWGYAIKSSRLKKFLREKFKILVLAKKGIFLDYHQSDLDLDYWFSYKMEDEPDERENTDCLLASEKGELQWNETENCKQCNQSVAKKEGWIHQWDGRKKTGKPKPKTIAYFHLECAKKYFVDKEQPNKKNTRIKEKLLRNLDKLCLDPQGYLANNEYLKTDGAEEEYNKLFNSDEESWKNRYLKIVIEGEEINLEEWDNSCSEYYEVKRELIKKIKSEIKQNPSRWKIERGEREGYSWDANWLVKHQKFGQRHWKIGLCGMHGKKEYAKEGKNYWTEIETLINGSSLPVPNNKNKDKLISDTEKEQIRQYFLKNDVKEIRFKDGKLIITHNNNNETKDRKEIFHDSELLKLMEYCQNSKGGKITKQSLGLVSNDTSTNSEPNNDNYKLVIGLSIGVGITILVGLIVFFVFRKRKNK